MAKDRSPSRLLLVGWREEVALPDLGIERIKAKVDTGAKTSALHASHIQSHERAGEVWLSFVVHWERQQREVEARLLEYRKVKSSNGKVQRRPVIQSHLELLGKRWLIELTLTQRNSMAFPMLLGRQALRKRILVDVSKSYLSRGDAAPVAHDLSMPHHDKAIHETGA